MTEHEERMKGLMHIEKIDCPEELLKQMDELPVTKHNNNDGSSYRFLTCLIPCNEKGDFNKELIEKFNNTIELIINNNHATSIFMKSPYLMVLTPKDKRNNKLLDFKNKSLFSDEITPDEFIQHRKMMFFYFTSDLSKDILSTIYGEEKFSEEGEMPKEWK